MPGDLETLYDAHAHRLYAHCWSLLGDHGAADAFKGVFTEAVRNPPRGETVLWLHHLARTVCSERGAFGHNGHLVFAQTADDPLLNAAGHLAADHREALLLYAGEWLEVRDIARVLCVSPDQVRKLLYEARAALERVVLDALMRGPVDPVKHMDVITAFEKGRLPHLLARRAPAWAPGPLRDEVLAAADHEEVGSTPAEPADPTRQLVVISSDAETAEPGRERARRRRALKGVGGVAGVAASVTVGLLMTWPSAGEGTVNALGPADGNAWSGTTPAGGNTRPAPAPTDGDAGDPGAAERPAGGQRVMYPAPAPAPTTEAPAPAPKNPPGSGGGTARPTPPVDDPTPTPSTPPSDSRETPTPPPTEEPSEPPEDGAQPDDPLDPLEPITDIVSPTASPTIGGLLS